MNQLTSLILAIPEALLAHQVRMQEHLDENVIKAESKRRQVRAKRKSGLTRDEEQAAERVKWLADVLGVLDPAESMTTAELGAVMGTTRMTAYRRLVVMEARGYVYRIGEGVSTRWLISEGNN